MRNRFEQQYSLGIIPIHEVKIRTKSRDSVPSFLAALQRIYITPEYNEKIFSILEDRLIKGKKRTAITTDQFHLIVDYHVMDGQSDSEIVKPLADRMFEQHLIESWSFDKGFWHKENKEHLSCGVEKIVMPKKGKCNNEEKAEESHPLFKKLRNKHSAIESNINELECRGLDRCPDKGYRNFKRYIGLAVGAYNLRRIGQELITQRKETERLKKLAA